VRLAVGLACALSAILIPASGLNRPLRAQAQADRWESSLSKSARQLTYSSTVALLGRPTTIRIGFFCDPTQTRTEHGALGFDLYVSNASALAPFAFDDFEGPDAPALKKPGLRVVVTRPGKPPLSFSVAPSGWYPGDGSFAFGVSAVSNLAGSQPRKLLTTLAEGAERLQITIADLRDPHLVLAVAVPVAGKQTQFSALLAGLTSR
jgi:hypothetical protein